MYPTLKNLDIVHFIETDGGDIQVGDVVIFYSPKSRKKVAHRVLSIEGRKIRTCSDFSWQPDPWTIKPGDIIGRVVSVQRGRRTKTIKGGKAGERYIRKLSIRRKRTAAVRYTFKPVYRLLLRIYFVRRILYRVLGFRIVSFQRACEEELQLVWGKHIIGRFGPQNREWQIKPPFRLFVDEFRLPRNSSELKKKDNRPSGKSI